MKTLSLRGRLTLFYSTILTVILAVFGFLFYDALGLVLENKLTAELRDRVVYLTAFQHLQAGEARLVGIVGQRAPDLVNREIDAVVEINERRFGPKATLNFFASDDGSRTFREKEKQTERLWLKFYKNA